MNYHHAGKQKKTVRLDSDLHVAVNYLVNDSKIKGRLRNVCIHLFTGVIRVKST